MVKQYKKYKETGIEWIGEIPNEWNVVKLKFLADTKFSSVDRHELEEELQVAICHYPQAYKNEKLNTETSLSSGTCSQNELDNFSLKKGQVIITKDSETADDIGIPTYVEEDIPNAVCGYHLAILQSAHKNFNTEFLFRYLQSNHVNYYFENNSNGVTRFGLGKSTIENLFVPLPSIEEQSQIAIYLDNQTGIIDQIISKKQKLIELLKEKRQAIINEAVTKGLNPNTKMKESGIEWLGKVPQHWRVARIGHYSQIIRGASPRPAGDLTLFGGDFMPWITVAEVTNGNGMFLYSTTNYLTELGSKQSRVIYPETLLLSNSGATLGVPKISKITGCINDGSVAFISFDKRLERDFLYYFFITHTETYRSEMAGYGQPNLNTDIVKSTKIPIPPIGEQQEIINHIESTLVDFETLFSKTNRQIEKLKEFRQSIISEAVTGKIDVREWQPNTNYN